MDERLKSIDICEFVLKCGQSIILTFKWFWTKKISF